jgi:hypothetical protein
LFRIVSNCFRIVSNCSNSNSRGGPRAAAEGGYDTLSRFVRDGPHPPQRTRLAALQRRKV